MKTIMIILTAAALQAQDAAFFTAVRADPPLPGTVGFIAGSLISGKPVYGAPYSAQAVTETVQVLADGNRISRKSTSTLYRDAAGRERREDSLPALGASNQAVQTIFISDPVAGVSYSLDPQTKTAHKGPAPRALQVGAQLFQTRVKAGLVVESRSFASEPLPGGQVQIIPYSDPQPKLEELGNSTMEGLVVEGKRTTTTIPAGQIGNERDINVVMERWYSPDLQMTIQSTQSDPRMGETTYKLTNISRAEPIASLFAPPADYTIDEGPTVRIRKE